MRKENKMKASKKVIGRLNKYNILCLVLLCSILSQIISIVQKSNAVKVNSDVIDWGLSYREEHAVPIGNAENENLLTYDACYTSSDEESNAVYLTFDAGYENGYTETILDTLKESNVKAAFFLTGNYFNTYPDLAKRMFEEGHLVCSHTMTHPDTTLLTKDEFVSQLTDLEKLCRDTTGCSLSKYYRPPSGRFDETTLTYAKELGYKTVLWSVTYLDWDNNNQKSHDEALTTLNKRMHNGAVILLHATSKTNSEILKDFISDVRNAGYEFKTLDGLF